MHERFDAIVIGGGATGTAVARDLAMRGAEVLLVERDDIAASGASGKNHGLLHSGGRYVVKDPESAEECARENRVLREIARHIVEPVGGYFVSIPPDPLDYADKFVEGCKRAGVEFHEVSTGEVLREEPNLNPEVQAAFWVNDAAIDPHKLCLLQALDAARCGATIKTYAEVVGLLFDGETVEGVRILDRAKGTVEEYRAEIVVNAAGAWVGRIASMAGITIPVTPNKGTLVVIHRRIVNHVVNRLRMPSDGDIIVPHHTASIIGTTSVNVEDPDKAYPTEPEVLKMLRAAAEIAPAAKSARMLRAYAAPRPLVGGGAGREISRTFRVFDHELEGVGGFVSIAGGKMCTCRLMAEKLSDLVCKKLGLRASCRTHVEPLPGAEREVDVEAEAKKYGLYNALVSRAVSRWGSLVSEFLPKVVERPSLKSVVCTCEMVTAAEVEYALRETWARSIRDLRRRCRTTAGTCQGQNCSYRLAGLVYEVSRRPLEEVLEDLATTLRWRWLGMRHVLYGDQLRQASLVLAVYNCVGNFDRIFGE